MKASTFDNGASTQPVAIDVRNVTKTFGSAEDSVRALDDVSITVRENEFFTRLRPSGCGKTTVLRLIAGSAKDVHGNLDRTAEVGNKNKRTRHTAGSAFLIPSMSNAV